LHLINETPENLRKKRVAVQGAGFRGGNWNNNASNARLSDRNNAANVNGNRNNNYGGRGVRSAAP
jgi:hypothetical protein